MIIRKILLVLLAAIMGGQILAEMKSGDTISFYIATDGNDDWSGTVADTSGDDGPFATLEKARDAIRNIKADGKMPGGGAVVNIRKGDYELNKTFELNAQDSGSENTRIVYRAYNDEKVRLIGGKRIKGFETVTDEAVLARIDKAARGKVLQVDLKALGIEQFGQLSNRGFGRSMQPAGLELFYDGRPMQIARWPNEGWVKVVSAPKGKDGGMFVYDGDRPKQWSKANDIWVHGYWTWDWADSYEKVERIDTEKREMYTQKPHGVYGYKAGQRYYALNILEELDQPGEWYLDRISGVLYFWPPDNSGKGEAIVSTINTMIDINDASNISIEDISIECCRGTAVNIVRGSGNLVAGCVIRNIGNRAVSITGGFNNCVVSCDITETGDGGIVLSGGDRMTLEKGEHFADNNHISRFSRWCRTYRPAVMVLGVGNKVSHNVIHDSPHNGIQLGGNDHLIEFNEIYDVCKETGDVGAFYMGRDWTARGTVIRHNFFHDLYGPYTHGAQAVYLDDATSGITIFGNVFYKASRAAFVGGGRDNTIENNIFVECFPSVHIDARGLGWAKEHIAKGGGWGMYKKLEKYKHDKPPYSERYPKLAGILDSDPPAPMGNVVRNNVSWGGRWMDLQGVKKELVVIENNMVGTEPSFVDAEKMNFALKEDSAVYSKLKGFKKIPFEKIGLYADKYRKDLSK